MSKVENSQLLSYLMDKFLCVPFGLCNSPAIFQRFINAIFRDLIQDKVVLTYMDDLIISSIDCETGIRNLQIVLKVANKTGLAINWSKCQFLQQHVEFRGHVIEDGRVSPSERKTETVRKFSQPKTSSKLSRIERILQKIYPSVLYYRAFID